MLETEEHICQRVDIDFLAKLTRFVWKWNSERYLQVPTFLLLFIHIVSLFLLFIGIHYIDDKL